MGWPRRSCSNTVASATSPNRSAMLGTLAGISLTFISMRPAGQTLEAAWIGLPVGSIIPVGFFTNIRLPGGIPVGLAALLVGTATGCIGGACRSRTNRPRVSDIAIGIRHCISTCSTAG